MDLPVDFALTSAEARNAERRRRIAKGELLMQEVNKTELTLAQVQALPFLGKYRNEWRCRTVELYRFAEGKVISVGRAFDESFIAIHLESDEDHWRALDAFKYGREYTAL